MRGKYGDHMADPVRVMLEHGKKELVVASAFDWPGWDRSARIGEDVLATLAAYRARYAEVAVRAGLVTSSGRQAISWWSKNSKVSE